MPIVPTGKTSGIGAFMAMGAGLKTEIVPIFFLALENVALLGGARGGKTSKATSTRPCVLGLAVGTLARLAFGAMIESPTQSLDGVDGVFDSLVLEI